MADRGGTSTRPGKTAAPSVDEPSHAHESMLEPLVTALGGGTLDFSAMLAIADIIPIPICYLDQQQIFRFANRAAAEWFERPRKAILGKSYEQMVGPAAYAARRPLLEEALAGERKFFAATFDHPNLGPRALQLDYVPWADAQGTVRGIIIFAPDITDERDAGRALKESEERFRRIANNAPVLMWVTALDRTREFVNDAYMEYLGIEDREFARNYDWREGIHPDDAERILAESIAGEASLKPFTLEGRFRRGDGTYRWLRSTSSPRFGPDGEHLGFIGAATDITLG
jgi:PAS domain S-box-containing protein